MKLAIVLLACLLAVAYADDHDHHDHHEHVEVIKQYADVDTEDFKYGLELSNHIKADQEGHLEDKHNWNVKGAYEYVTKDGKHVHVSYHADDHGYHPVVDY